MPYKSRREFRVTGSGRHNVSHKQRGFILPVRPATGVLIKWVVVGAVLIGAAVAAAKIVDTYGDAIDRAAHAQADLKMERALNGAFRSQVRVLGEQAATKAAAAKAQQQQINTRTITDYEKRLALVNDAYRGLRDQRAAGDGARGGRVPALASAAAAAPADCRADVARTLDAVERGLLRILEAGDTEQVKLGELWRWAIRQTSVGK